MDQRILWCFLPFAVVMCQPPVFYVVEDVTYEGGELTMMCADFPNDTRFVNWYKWRDSDSEFAHIYAYTIYNDSGKAEGEYRGRDIDHKEEEFGYTVKMLLR